MNKSKNERSVTYKRTEEEITKAFFSLLEKKDFHSITVSDIIKKAGVNRSTFYRHYEDKYAILDKISEIAHPVGEQMVAPFVVGGGQPFDVLFNSSYLWENVPESYKHTFLLLLKVKTESFDMERIVKDGFAAHYDKSDTSAAAELKRELYADICYRMLIYSLSRGERREDASGIKVLEELMAYITRGGAEPPVEASR